MAGTAYALEFALTIHGVKNLTAAGNYVILNDGVINVKKTVPAATQITLPTNPVLGKHIFVKDAGGVSGANNITVIPDGVGVTTIDGSANFVIGVNYGEACFVYNGTEWNVVFYYTAISTSQAGFLSGVTPGTVTAGKAIVVDNSSNFTMSAGVASLFGLTINDVGSIAAAGTVITNATAIVNAVSNVSGANDAAGVILPATTIGKVVMVYSSQATNGLKIYPPVNSTINGGSANSSINIEGKTLAVFVGLNATNWGSIFTVNA